MDSVAHRLSVVGAGAALELRGVTRLFGALAALTDVTLTVRPGERRARGAARGEQPRLCSDLAAARRPGGLRGDELDAPPAPDARCEPIDRQTVLAGEGRKDHIQDKMDVDLVGEIDGMGRH